MIDQRTRVIGVFYAEQRVHCDNILHYRQSDQSEQQRDDVVNVVFVPGVDLSGWKDHCPVCRCASCLFTQCSSQRSISAMTRCHWRNEDDVAKRYEPHDVVAEKRLAL